jgi:hypothetical protein
VRFLALRGLRALAVAAGLVGLLAFQRSILFNRSVAPAPGEGRELARDGELMAKAPGQGDQAIR